MSVVNAGGVDNRDNNFQTPLTHAEQSELQALISQIFKIHADSIKKDSQSSTDTIEVYNQLRNKLHQYDNKIIPKEIINQLGTAKKIVQSKIVFKHLCKESSDLILKAQKIIQRVNEKILQLKDTMDAPALQREKQRRLAETNLMLLDLRKKILSCDLMEVQKYPELVKALEDIGKVLDISDPTDILQARLLHGLHLEVNLPVGFEKVTEASVHNYSEIRALNIETVVTQDSQFFSAQEREGHLNRIHIQARHLFIPLKDSIFEGKDIRDKVDVVDAVNIYTVSTMAGKIGEDVKKYSTNTNYNSWPALTKFIDHYHNLLKENRSLNPIEAYRNFDPDYEDSQEFGTACTGQAIEMLHLLKERHKIHGYLVVQKEGATGIPIHTALVIPCKDGILLVETMNKKQPIIAVKPDQKTHMEIFGDQASLEIDSTTGPYTKLVKVAYEKNRDGSVHLYKTEFPLAEISTKAVMLKYLVDRTEFSLWNETVDYSILINVHDGNIVFKKGQGREAFRKTIPFADINSVEADQLMGQFCLKMKVPKDKALLMMKKIVDNHIIIKDLLKATRTPINTYKSKAEEILPPTPS